MLGLSGMSNIDTELFDVQICALLLFESIYSIAVKIYIFGCNPRVRIVSKNGLGGLSQVLEDKRYFSEFKIIFQIQFLLYSKIPLIAPAALPGIEISLTVAETTNTVSLVTCRDLIYYSLLFPQRR